MNDEAEIIDADMVDIPDSDYNPNQTQQVVNLVQITPTVDFSGGSSAPKRNSKLQKETIRSIIKLYNSISEEYGFQANFDIENIQKNFEEIISDDQEEFFRVIISKAFSKFQLVFYQRAMNSIMALMDQISSPEVINDMSVSIEWKYGMINQLLQLMTTVSDLYEKVKVDHPELTLRQLASRQAGDGDGLKDIQMSKGAISVMKQLRNISLQYNDKTKNDKQ